MATYTNLSSVSTDGVVESTMQGVLLGSFATMPTASASNAGCIVLYTGATIGDYTQDRFYQCVNNSGTYSWVQITVADTPSLSGYVPTSRKVAGHALTADVSISASDVGAVPTTRKVNGNALSSDVTITLASLGGVPDTRTVNNKALSSDISLGASDVSAIPSSYLSTSKPTSSSTDTEVPTSKAVYTAVNEVSSAVSNEASARSGADNSLQSQIDALIAKSDVVDIVGTYADLQAYPTSGLGNNDIVKVLSDSTHSNMTTYYRWSTSTSSWTYIGGEGPYLTTSSAQSTYVPKTTTINSKALSGNITLGASDVSAIPSSYLSTSAPSSSSTDSQVPTAKAVYTKTNAIETSAYATSGITSAKVSTYDGYASGKQNALATQQITVPTTLGAVSVSGVTANSTVWVAPDPTSFDVYTTAGVYCSAQGAGTLTFTSSKTPTANMTVNVVIAN